MTVRRRRALLAASAALPLGLAAGGGGAAGPRDVDPPILPAVAEALAALRVPSVSLALIERGSLAWARTLPDGAASTRTLYQAASLSKTASALAALRLVQQGRLDLDGDVDARLTSWHLPASPLTRERKVTLRGLLSMTAGIGVPGYSGYPVGAPLPDLAQILGGRPPANSPPVRVEHVPGTRFAYSGGGYQIVQSLVQDVTGTPFADAVQGLVLRPLEMVDSVFAQPLPAALAGRAARGHDSGGAMLPGGWRVVPELAAGGLWSTPTDLARLLIAIMRAWRGEDAGFLEPRLAWAMLTATAPGPDGLGGAVAGPAGSPVLMKRGQNIGYQAYMLVFPATGQGMVVMTGSDNGSRLAETVIRRAAVTYGWPPLGTLMD
jgi:CubicO group peptidase (beta-lactamase class C family)